MKMPMPGDRIANSTVLASVILCEDADGAPEEATVVLLNGQRPYYTVAVVREAPVNGATYEIIDAINHYNIVDAINGNDFPNQDPDNPHRMVGPRAYGYVDMGGDV